MFRLAAIVYVLCATVLAGAAVTAMLSSGMFDRTMLASAAIAGAVVALPVAWVVARQLLTLTRH